jgi:hypothetical protein
MPGKVVRKYPAKERSQKRSVPAAARCSGSAGGVLVWTAVRRSGGARCFSEAGWASVRVAAMVVEGRDHFGSEQDHQRSDAGQVPDRPGLRPQQKGKHRRGDAEPYLSHGEKGG